MRFIKKYISIVFILQFFCVSSQNLEGSFDNKFKRYKANEQFSGIVSKEWNTLAWKGEKVLKQLVLWSNLDIDNLNFTISNLASNNYKIEASNIKLYVGNYVKGDPEARSCSEYPSHDGAVNVIDALSEVNTITLSNVNPVKLWVEVTIPFECAPDDYVGTITVDSGGYSQTFINKVKVVEWVLPKPSQWKFHLDLWQFPINVLNQYNTANPSNEIKIWSDEHFAQLKPSYKLLASMGQKAITTYIKDGALGDESMIKWIKNKDGSWTYDFSVFDKYVSTLMSWEITGQINCFSPVGWNETVIPYWDESTNTMMSINAPLNSVVYRERWNHFLSAFKIFLDGKGWFDKTVLYLDEVSEDKLNSIVSVVHGNNPNWKLGIAYSHGLSNEVKENFYDLSGILEDASNEGVSKDKVSTFYTSCTQKVPNNYVTPQNDLAEMSWMGWYALSNGFDGYLRWAYDFYQNENPLDAREGTHTSGDFEFIYRNPNDESTSFLPSLRLFMLREGIQDFEKITIIKSQFEQSNNKAKKQGLNQLKELLNKFTKSSGANARQLIEEGQHLIKELSKID